MRVTLQRVKSAQVTVAGEELGAIQQGLLLFVGIAPTDELATINQMAAKIVKMRIFEDQAGKMNLSLPQVQGNILSISQFTLYADTRKGNRPSFQGAAQPTLAKQLYQAFNQALTHELGQPIATGEFGADMLITAVNDGPVTINLELPHD